MRVNKSYLFICSAPLLFSVYFYILQSSSTLRLSGFIWAVASRSGCLFNCSCSTQLSMKFKLLINIEIAKNDGILG